jgi:hypothetical protein
MPTAFRKLVIALTTVIAIAGTTVGSAEARWGWGGGWGWGGFGVGLGTGLLIAAAARPYYGGYYGYGYPYYGGYPYSYGYAPSAYGYGYPYGYGYRRAYYGYGYYHRLRPSPLSRRSHCEDIAHWAKASGRGFQSSLGRFHPGFSQAGIH